MPQPSITVRDFVTNSYQIINASSPTVPLHGSDLSIGITILNQLLNEYSSTGLMITVSKQIDFNLNIGQNEVTFGPADFVPTPDITTEGRLVNLLNAWVSLNGVTYPLIDESRTEFYSSYKYDPLIGLPRYVIVIPQTNITTIRVFPGPSQLFALSVYAKFQPATLTSNTDMSELPSYYYMYLQFALAKYLAAYKGRMEAWTDKLESMYIKLKQDMEASSSTNLDININNESWLNGAWRVRAGI